MIIQYYDKHFNTLGRFDEKKPIRNPALCHMGALQAGILIAERKVSSAYSDGLFLGKLGVLLGKTKCLYHLHHITI